LDAIAVRVSESAGSCTSPYRAELVRELSPGLGASDTSCMSVNLVCPSCDQPLVTVKAVGAVTWRCTKCRGASIGIGLLKRPAPAGRAGAIWRSAFDPNAAAGTACPSCAKPTKPFALEDGLKGSACRPCLVVWFDGEELRRFAPERQESSATPSSL